jgi:hypothetical protein
VALAVLAPATIAYTFSTEWLGYYAERPSQPVHVDAGEPAEFAGTTWRLLDAERVGASSARGEAAELPDGTDLVLVHVSVDPHDLDASGRSPACDVQLDELSGAGGSVQRSWGDARYENIDYETELGSFETGCNAELTTPYEMEWVYLVPSDAGGDLALQLETLDELPRYLHLALDPLPSP